jgi:hypothetical protein
MSLDPHRQLNVARAGAHGLTRGVFHSKQASQVRTTARPHFKRGQFYSGLRRTQRNASRQTRCNSRSEQPAWRDLFAAAAEFGRHVRLHLRAIGMTGVNPRTALPARSSGRIIMQTHLGPAPKD